MFYPKRKKLEFWDLVTIFRSPILTIKTPHFFQINSNQYVVDLSKNDFTSVNNTQKLPNTTDQQFPTYKGKRYQYKNTAIGIAMEKSSSTPLSKIATERQDFIVTKQIDFQSTRWCDGETLGLLSFISLNKRGS